MTDSDLNEIIERCALYSRDPLGFVRWAFDWGEGELAQHDGPDEWQRDILGEIVARLRDGSDITIEVPVSVATAVLGGKISVPTTAGPVNLTVPPQSSTGTKLRLRGRGIPARGGKPAGDQYVTLKIVLNPKDETLAKFLREREAMPDFDPRRDLMGAA